MGAIDQFTLNDWSFGQLCGLARVGKMPLDLLRSQTALQALRGPLPDDRKPLQVLATDYANLSRPTSGELDSPLLGSTPATNGSGLEAPSGARVGSGPALVRSVQHTVTHPCDPRSPWSNTAIGTTSFSSRRTKTSASCANSELVVRMECFKFVFIRVDSWFKHPVY